MNRNVQVQQIFFDVMELFKSWIILSDCYCIKNYWLKAFDYLEHGGWGEWSSWYPYDRPCGPTKSIRQRKCNSPVPKYRGRSCPSTEAVQTTWTNLTECIRKFFSSFIHFSFNHLIIFWLIYSYMYLFVKSFWYSFVRRLLQFFTEKIDPHWNFKSLDNIWKLEGFWMFSGVIEKERWLWNTLFFYKNNFIITRASYLIKS